MSHFCAGKMEGLLMPETAFRFRQITYALIDAK